HRLAATRQCVATGAGSVTAADVVATLRHHGDRAWGAPSGDPAAVSPPPTDVQDDWRGVTVCMHVHGAQVTNASIVAELPGDRRTRFTSGAWRRVDNALAKLGV